MTCGASDAIKRPCPRTSDGIDFMGYACLLNA
jgi:hypothetical protein